MLTTSREKHLDAFKFHLQNIHHLDLPVPVVLVRRIRCRKALEKATPPNSSPPSPCERKKARRGALVYKTLDKSDASPPPQPSGLFFVGFLGLA